MNSNQHYNPMKQAACPFGDAYARYWDMRYDLFSRFDEGIQTDAEGLFSAKPELLAFEAGRLFSGNTILDAFGGVGGSAIGFARNGKQVICVEADAARCAMIKNNVAVYGLSRQVSVIHDDVTRIKDDITYDAVYLDPPWGGPDYIRQKHFRLHDFNPDGNLLLESFGDTKEVMLTVPVNFDFSEFAKYQRDYTLQWGILRGKKSFANIFMSNPY